MNSSDRAAAIRLAGRAAVGVTSVVQQTHGAINGRVRRVLGSPAVPVQVAQGAVATGVYAAVRGGLALGSTAAAAASRLVGEDAPRTPRQQAVISALNGAAGGQLAAEGSALAVQLATHIEGEPTPRMAVLIHGLGECAGSWRSEPDYRPLLRELGWTPVLVTYNSGLSVWQNGELLATELERLLSEWPMAVDEVALVGHSMGGLVARAAIDAGQNAESEWVGQVCRLVTLGTPHEGAPLARLGRRVRALADRLPETRGLGSLIDYSRSPGIADLCDGDIHADPSPAAELPDHISVRTLCVTLGSTERHIVSRLLGDLLVTAESATSLRSGRRADDDRAHVGGLHHFDLLGHRDVWPHLERWMQ